MTNSFLYQTKERIEALTPAYVILPVPYEESVSYKGGTSGGPAAILEASLQLEDYDDEVCIEACNIKGIRTNPPLDLTGKNAVFATEAIYAASSQIIKEGLIPILLGGEHTISIGPIKAALEKFPDLHVIHVDAHADLRDSYEDNPYSHACVMKRIYDLGVPIHSAGVRALSKGEGDFIRENEIHVLFDYQRRQQKHWVNDFLETIPKNSPIYLTIDVDGLDPAIIPHTGTPVPGGLSWDEILELCRAIIERFVLTGFDVVELAPQEGGESSDFLVAQLIYKIISYREALCRASP